MVPLLSAWHPFHARTVNAYERLRQQGAPIVVTAHALWESFAALTRMTEPYRFPPEEAERLLRENFFQNTETPRLKIETVWVVIREMAKADLGGSRIYDTVIAFASHRAGARVLLTWKVRHFLPVAPAGLEIREP